MIETERLYLTPFSEEYKSEILNLLQDSDFMQFSPQVALSTLQAIERYNEILCHYQKYAFAKMLIIHKKDNQVLGYCGFENFLYKEQTEIELGFRIRKNDRNKGYAFEAASALINDIKNRGLETIFAFSEPYNINAHQLLFKLGFTPIASENLLNLDVILFKQKLF